MNRPRDLQRRKHQSAGGVEDDVERNVIVRHLDRSQQLFGIIDVDVTHERKSQKPHGFLPVHEQNHTGVSLLFQLANLACAHGLEHPLTQHRLDRGEHEEQPE